MNLEIFLEIEWKSNYLGMDRSWPRIRPRRTNRHQHGPSRLTSGFGPIGVFVTHQTKIENRSKSEIWKIGKFLIFEISDTLKVTYSVFSFTDLEDFEFLTTSTQRHLAVNLIINPLHIGQWSAILPIRSQSGDKFSPINHSIAMIEFVRHSVHFQSWTGELVLEDSIDEIVPGQETVTVLVQLPEQVGNSGFLVVVVLQESFAPIVPIEILDLFQFLQIVQFFFEATVPFPSHHPDMTPFLPKGLGTRILVVVALAHAGTAENLKKLKKNWKNWKKWLFGHTCPCDLQGTWEHLGFDSTCLQDWHG